MDAHGISYRCIDLYETPTRTSVPDADALVILGGSMSANDDSRFIRREIDYTRAAIQAGIPVLGICLGAQIIAKALGCSVYANPQKEIGWAPVTFLEAARHDPLFEGYTSEMIFHWHKETFDLPEGAELLASSVDCRNQAFRLRQHVYGFQFHLEVTPEMISQWCREDSACGARESPEFIDPYAHASQARNLATIVFGRWCNLIQAQCAKGRNLSGRTGG